jgi:SAM-dependent methyltransferase
MNDETEFLRRWKAEEEIAYIHGWDFSHIAGRYEEPEALPWDYRETILGYLKPEWKILDMDTGGGEFLLSLGHPYGNTAATENYPPNVVLCRDTLLPLGIDFRPGDGNGTLPFSDGSFDLVINRHGDFHPREIFRLLKPGGLFITQQVGAENDRELVTLLCGDTPIPFPEQYLDLAEKQFRGAGFEILERGECFRPMRFFDVGALVWFARVLPWEFPGLSVDTHLEGLRRAQTLLEETGCIPGSTHRFLLVAEKPK